MAGVIHVEWTLESVMTPARRPHRARWMRRCGTAGSIWPKYERRLVIVQAAKVQNDSRRPLADLTGSGHPGPAPRILAADRERATGPLAECPHRRADRGARLRRRRGAAEPSRHVRGRRRVGEQLDAKRATPNEIGPSHASTPRSRPDCWSRPKSTTGARPLQATNGTSRSAGNPYCLMRSSAMPASRHQPRARSVRSRIGIDRHDRAVGGLPERQPEGRKAVRGPDLDDAPPTAGEHGQHASCVTIDDREPLGLGGRSIAPSAGGRSAAIDSIQSRSFVPGIHVRSSFMRSPQVRPAGRRRSTARPQGWCRPRSCRR